jgi:hypothetical protein
MKVNQWLAPETAIACQAEICSLASQWLDFCAVKYHLDCTDVSVGAPRRVA